MRSEKANNDGNNNGYDILYLRCVCVYSIRRRYTHTAAYTHQLNYLRARVCVHNNVITCSEVHTTRRLLNVIIRFKLNLDRNALLRN